MCLSLRDLTSYKNWHNIIADDVLIRVNFLKIAFKNYKKSEIHNAPSNSRKHLGVFLCVIFQYNSGIDFLGKTQHSSIYQFKAI